MVESRLPHLSVDDEVAAGEDVHSLQLVAHLFSRPPQRPRVYTDAKIRNGEYVRMDVYVCYQEFVNLES